jgi:hypothetical protein
MFTTGKYFPCCVQRQFPPLALSDRLVEHHFHAVMRQMGSSIKEMPRESAILPLAIDAIHIHSMIIIYLHSDFICKNNAFSLIIHY